MSSRDQSATSAETGARYEFRIWSESLTRPRMRLEALSGPQAAKQSRETYILSDVTDDTNAKIRVGVVDIKVVLRRKGMLEQWTPVLKADFPIEAALVAQRILQPLQVATPTMSRSDFTLEEFLDEVIKPHPRLTAVEIEKVRRQYELGDCRAEFAEVKLGEHSAQTIAVESLNESAVLEAVRTLAIGEYPNTSYVRQIKSILGRI